MSSPSPCRGDRWQFQSKAVYLTFPRSVPRPSSVNRASFRSISLLSYVLSPCKSRGECNDAYTSPFVIQVVLTHEPSTIKERIKDISQVRRWQVIGSADSRVILGRYPAFPIQEGASLKLNLISWTRVPRGDTVLWTSRKSTARKSTCRREHCTFSNAGWLKWQFPRVRPHILATWAWGSSSSAWQTDIPPHTLHLLVQNTSLFNCGRKIPLSRVLRESENVKNICLVKVDNVTLVLQKIKLNSFAHFWIWGIEVTAVTWWIDEKSPIFCMDWNIFLICTWPQIVNYRVSNITISIAFYCNWNIYKQMIASLDKNSFPNSNGSEV